VKPFTFVQFSDTHIGNKGYDDRLRQALADVDAEFGDAAFIINTGDLTEMGWEGEFQQYLEIAKTSKRPIYTCVGNHDERWSESGKGNYKKYMGDTYRTWDYNGVRFILMDVTIQLQHHGHFDAGQLKRLETDLKSMPEGMPAIIGMHQPPLNKGHFFDNEMEFVRLISHYNVPLVLTGHGHGFDRYSYNGTTYCMGGTTSDKGSPPHSYRVYHVGPDGIAAERRIFDTGKTFAESAMLTTTTRTQPTIEVCSCIIDGLDLDGTTSYDLYVPDRTSFMTSETCTYEVDHWTTGTTAGQTANVIAARYDSMANGCHQLVATEVLEDGTTVVADAGFPTGSVTGAPSVLRLYVLPGGTLSAPVVAGDRLFAGGNDGKIRAYELDRTMPISNSFVSEPFWSTDLHGEIVSSPAVTSDTIIVGSMDGSVYCVNQKGGAVRWTFKTGNAIQASPLVTSDTVFIGSGDYNMYALDVATGKERWRFAAKKHIKHSPALTADGRLIFGAWDNQLYCLDSATGALIWQVPASTLPGGHFSAATSNPVTTGSFVVLCTHDWCVRCFGVLNGGQQWIYRPKPGEFGPCQSTAALRGNVAYFGSINGHIVGHDCSTGEKVFDFDVRPEKPDAFYDSSPLIVGDKLYIGSVGGYVYCINLPAKSVEWRVAVQPGFVFANVVRWKDRLLVATTADRVYEIGPVKF
jgi:outer membrane protein assembly factor BamB